MDPRAANGFLTGPRTGTNWSLDAAGRNGADGTGQLRPPLNQSDMAGTFDDPTNTNSVIYGAPASGVRCPARVNTGDV
ncbi:hypothetical protein D5041_08575 [Verminephrobacter aporrectodeae subsp. tuberculatae]|uniref:hypothetical protein n=1 Tax=Verminephrobacter aporrectodeae TaxID=1110389 RepID=UPI0022370DD8|nr:hypothetical protein [Verminephrobacter aporrectodeae]MCW5289112.1 hypothetical protein [Verminephrobacter aporrectodeae subsp. tuberculatae]